VLLAMGKEHNGKHPFISVQARINPGLKIHKEASYELK
jgi:hypothetical protein